jgi:hypothetical protein
MIEIAADQINRNDTILEPTFLNAPVGPLTATEDGNEPKFHVENRNGNVVVVDGLGNVVATLQKSKKLSYESGLQAKFQQKRLDKIKSKQSK